MASPTSEEPKRQRQGARKQLAKNALLSSITSASDVFLLTTLILAGRFLGVQGFGVFALALAATTLITFFTSLGLNDLAIREIVIRKEEAARLIGSLMGWKTVLSSLVAVVFLVVVGAVFEDVTARHTAYILCFAAIARSFNLSFRSYLRAFERFDLETIIVLFDRIALFCCGLIVLWTSRNPVYLAWAFLFVRCATLVAFVVVLRSKVCRFSLDFNPRLAGSLQLTALPLGAAALFQGIYMQIDTLMLAAMRTQEEVGLFNAPMKMFEGLMVAAFAINSVVYPRLSALSQNDSSRHEDLFGRTLKYMFLLGLPVALAGILFSEELILLFFGKDFLPASRLLMLLLVAVGLRYMIGACLTLFRSMAKFTLVMGLGLGALTFKFLANLVLIPKLGIEGAGLALLSCELITLVAALALANQLRHRRIASARCLLKILAAATLGFLAASSMSTWPFLIRAGSLLTVYGLCLAIFGVFDKYETALLESYLPPFMRSRLFRSSPEHKT